MLQGQEEGGSVSLAEHVGQMFGDVDLSDNDEPGESDSTADAGGATPPEHATETVDPNQPEGTEPGKEVDKEPGDATSPGADQEPDPDKAAETQSDADDPLAGATPFTYTVNGETRTFDGIKVLGEDGAIVDAKALPDLMRRLGERDNLYETNQAQYQRVQDLERLSKWDVTDEKGNLTHSYEGQEGLVQMRVQAGRMAASLHTMMSVFQKDANGQYPKLASIITVDEAGNVVPDQTALQHLITESELSEIRAEQEIKSLLSKLTSTERAAASQDFSGVSSPEALSQLQSQAPALIDQAAKSAGLDAKVLTEKDRSFLGNQLPRYVRTVTERDRMSNPSLKLGGPIVDASFMDVVKDRLELRAESAKTVQDVTQSVTKASNENAARLAAAARGVKPTTQNTQRRPEPKQEPEESEQDQLWASLVSSGAAALRRRA